MGTRIQHVAAVAVVVPVLAFTAACSGGGGGSGDGGAKDKGAPEETRDGAGAGGGGAAKAGIPPLSTAKLESALLAKGDVPGWTTGSADADAVVPEKRFTADREACEPVADVLSSEPKYARTAYTSGSLVRGDAAAGGAMHAVLLAAYERGGAEKWLTELRGAVRSCESFTGGGEGGSRYEVSPVDAGAPVGDDSVAFRLSGAGDASDLVVTVVRTGGNTASYLSFGVADAPDPIERKVAVRQHEKLVEAAGS